MLAPRSQRTVGVEALFGSCRGPPGSVRSGRTVSRRGLVLLHLEAVGAKPRRTTVDSFQVRPPSP